MSEFVPDNKENKVGQQRKILVGLAGPAGVGKDTAARYLREEFGLMHTAFADPIKDALNAMGFERTLYDRDALKDIPIERFGVSYRYLAQTLGTEWGRSIIPDFWLRLAQVQYDRIEFRDDSFYSGMVISDVRFENEAQWVRKEGLLIHITGPARRQIAKDGAKHSSEAGVSRLPDDVIVANTGTPHFMFSQLQNAIHQTFFR